MSTTNILALLLFSLLFTISTTSSTTYHRHLLHQPFFPLISTIPPTQPPSFSPQPKFPFSTTPQKPFFPSFSSPHPPPPPAPPSVSSLTTFPANISSLLFPDPHSSSSHRNRNLILTLSISLSLLLAAFLAALLAYLVYFRRHHHHTPSEKASRTDSLRLFPSNTIPSDGSPKPPKLGNRPGVSNTSREFLYLGTLANTGAGVDDQGKLTNWTNGGVKIGVSSSPYQKLGSPELNPLPPLPKHNNFASGEVLVTSNKADEAETDDRQEQEAEDEEEEFFSPRGSSGRKDPHETHVESSSRREFLFQGENFGSRSFNSRTASYPYSNSCSPTNSISTIPSPLSNSSPRTIKSKSPHTIITIPAAFRPVKPSISLSEQGSQSAMLPPPPPPPSPPPPRFWEMPVGVGLTREVNYESSGPPVLVGPSRPVFTHSMPTSAKEQMQSNGNAVRSAETTKPKLKPLHWDKVRASSDRAMVWDQIKSSSFQ